MQTLLAMSLRCAPACREETGSANLPLLVCHRSGEHRPCRPLPWVLILTRSNGTSTSRFDFDRPGCRLFSSGHRQSEHTIRQARLNLIGIKVARQRKVAREIADLVLLVNGAVALWRMILNPLAAGLPVSCIFRQVIAPRVNTLTATVACPRQLLLA